VSVFWGYLLADLRIRAEDEWAHGNGWPDHVKPGHSPTTLDRENYVAKRANELAELCARRVAVLLPDGDVVSFSSDANDKDGAG